MNDRRVGPRAVVAAVVLVCLSGVPACESSGTQMPAIVDAPEPVALTERDIAKDRAYFASTKETLFFSLESPDGEDDPAAADTGGRGYDIAPFIVEEPQTISLCPDKGVESYEVEIDQGGAAVLSASSGKCATATLDAGSYELKLTRDASAGRAPPMPMFVHSAMVDASQCPADVDSFSDYENLWLLTTARGAVWGRGGFDTGNVTIFPNDNDTVYGPGLMFDPGLGVRFQRLDAASGSIVMFSDKGLPAVAIGSEAPLQIGAGGPLTWLNTLKTGTPGGGYDGATPHIFQPLGSKWSFGPRAIVQGAQYAWMDAEVSSNPWVYVGTPSVGTSPTPMSVTLAMRAFLSPTRYPKPLGLGEVSFTPTNSPWITYVINDSNAFPTDFSRIGGMRGGPYTINTACDTSVYLYSAPNFGGDVRFVGKSTTVERGVALSARVVRTKKLLIETNACTNCNLASVNLSGYTLSNVKLTDVDMTKANLSNAQMDGAQLDSVNLEGAKLSNTSFHGATFRNVGLTGTDIRQTQFSAIPNFTATIAPDPCATGPLGNDASRLARTRATLKELPPSIWRYLDLSDVIFDPTGVPPAELSLAGADVCGSRLARASLNGWNLERARFDKSDLTGTKLQSVTGSGASFRGATLTRTDLTGAVLANPSFDGATGDSAVFNNVTFTGGSMLEATLPGVVALYATFTGVDMTRASFEVGTSGGSSSFFGASFTSSKLDSAKLSNVFMNFTTFTGSSMIESRLLQTSFNDSVFSATNLTAADARSANFTGAAFFNVTMTNALFGRASDASTAVSFEHAVFCGGTFAPTDLSSALLTGALFPTADMTLASAAGPVTCLAVPLQGLITTSNTICPNGLRPASTASGCAGTDWVAATPPAPPCCDPSKQTCRYLKAGYACKADCDCRSKKCAASGLCAE
jgi:uncharacterized protein YjbI with pentapeptide repeats